VGAGSQDWIAEIEGAFVAIAARQWRINTSRVREAYVGSAYIGIVTREWLEEAFAENRIALLYCAWITVSAIHSHVPAFVAFHQDAAFCHVDCDDTEIDSAFVGVFTCLQEGGAVTRKCVTFVDGARVVVVADGRLILAVRAVTFV